MKVKPKTPEGFFAAARTIIASRHYKIFTPNRQYFRQKHQFIAATVAFGKKRLFLLQLREDKLVVRFLPPKYGDISIIPMLENELGIRVKQGKSLIRLDFDDPWKLASSYVTSSQQLEFDVLITNTIDARLR